jgi:hypothetical protein
VVSQTAAALGSGANVTINITGGGAGNGTINAYRTAAKTATTGQRTYQVIKVGRGRNVTFNGADRGGLERRHGRRAGRGRVRDRDP